MHYISNHRLLFGVAAFGLLAGLLIIAVLLQRQRVAAEPFSIDVYIADTGANRIQRLDQNGVRADGWLIQAGDDWGFNRPEAIAAGPDNRVYVLDSDNDILRVFDETGAQVDTWGGLGAQPGKFRSPHGITVADDGTVYVVDSGNNRIQKFSPDGDLLLVWGERGTEPGQFILPQNLVIDENGWLHIVDHQNHRIQVFNSEGTFLGVREIAGDPEGGFYFPEGIAIAPDGTFYVTDWNHRIVHLDANGNVLNVWGQWGERDGEFKYPSGLEVDRCGHVWVADWGNHRIQRFDADGAHLTTWGFVEWWSGEFLYPSDISIVTHGTSCEESDEEPPPGSLVAIPRSDGSGAGLPPTGGSAEVGPSGHFDEIQVANDGTKYLIPLEMIQSGGPGVDGIPALVHPEFVGPEEWDAQNYRPDDLVMGVEVDGERRAYPLQILDWHEIVNDTVNGKPLLITYCPLCGSAIVFERQINGEVVEFGVSGQLYNSDLLMYDRMSDTLWSQLTGAAVVGDLTGQRLEIYPSELITWADWQERYPDSVVLSRNTGYGRPYDTRAYGDYANEDNLLFQVSQVDNRLPNKERVTGVELDGEIYAAYPDRQVARYGPVNDDPGGVPLLVVADSDAGDQVVVFERTADGQILTFAEQDGQLVDQETGSEWTYGGVAVAGPLTGAELKPVNPVRSFWFAWFAFHPTTELWQATP